MTNNLPDRSIKGAGGLENYINKFFLQRNIPKTYEDFVALTQFKKIPLATRARELGVSLDAFKNWLKLYNATNNESTK